MKDPSPPRRGPEPEPVGLRVLAVDHPELEPLLRRIRGEGVTVQTAPATAEVEDLAQQPRGGHPVVLLRVGTDAHMDTLRAFADRVEQVPVIAVSAAADGITRAQVRKCGAAAHLVLDRPGGDTLVDLLEEWAARHRLSVELERTRARVHEAREQFRNTVERVADGIVIVGEEGQVLHANPASGEIFGMEPDDLVGEEFGLPLVTGETTEVEIVSGTPEPRVAELRAAETAWGGEPASLVSIRDITARRESEERERSLIREQAARQAAEASAERGAFLAEASRVLFTSLRRSEIVRSLASLAAMNPGDLAIVDLLGEQGDPPTRRHVQAREFVPGAAVACLEGQPETLAEEPGVRRLLDEAQARLVQPVEPGWIASLVQGDPDELVAAGPTSAAQAPLVAGQRVVGCLTVLALGEERPALGQFDLTVLEELGRRAGLALENARLFRAAEAASRAKSDFLNVISHELRTPLTGIVGYAGLMREDVAENLGEKQDEFLSGIERSSQQLLRVIDQILLFAATEADREEASYEAVSLGQLVEDVAALAGPMAEREGLRFEAEVDDAERRFTTDGAKVHQILLHLLANAVKFTQEGTIRLRARVRSGQEGDLLVLEVSDTGIGIAASELKRIFEPFTQVQPSSTRTAGGTGIGLNVARNLVRLLNGSLDVDSEPGEGSVFTVTIPLPEETPEEAGGAGGAGKGTPDGERGR